MPKAISKKAAKKRAYSETTRGSELARKTRASANRLSEAKRAALFDQAMQVVYGGRGRRKTVGSR